MFWRKREEREFAYIEDLYRRHGKAVFVLCCSFLGSRTEAQDAVQNVFMKLFDHPRSFKDEVHERAWLIRCAQNHCRDVLRRRKRTSVGMTCDVSEMEAAAPVVGRTQWEGESGELEDLSMALQALPDNLKAIVFLTYYEGLTSEEVAKTLGMTASTVRNKLAEARGQLELWMKGLSL